MMIRTVIIDDEYLNRDLISKLIHKLNEKFDIIGTAENIDDGFNLIAKHNPDLIFLDIKMPGGNGFELLKRFKNPKFEVVFITGFDEYALQAFDFNALDYVLKPIDTFKLSNTLDKVYNRISNKSSLTSQLKEILRNYDGESYIISKIPIHHGDKVELIDITDIITIEADKGYTVFNTVNSCEFISSKQFSTFEFIVEKHRYFVKINKGLYINTKFIKNYSKGETCFITLKNDKFFEVSRRKKTKILSLLER